MHYAQLPYTTKWTPVQGTVEGFDCPVALTRYILAKDKVYELHYRISEVSAYEGFKTNRLEFSAIKVSEGAD